jgi:hypothetical protein
MEAVVVVDTSNFKCTLAISKMTCVAAAALHSMHKKHSETGLSLAELFQSTMQGRY